MPFEFSKHEFDNDSDFMKWFIDIVKIYGFTDYRKPFGKGTYAVTYLKGNRIYRFTKFSATPNLARKTEKIYRKVSEVAYDAGVGPKMHSIEMLRRGTYNQYILFSVQEKLNSIDWRKWKEVYSSEKELLNAAMDVCRKMKETGLAHMDISTNNAFLTKKGIKLIDWDDGCFNNTDDHELKKNCEVGISGTPGSTPPEYAFQSYGGTATGKHGVMLKEFILREYGLDYSKKKDKIIAKNNFTSLLRANVYSFASVVYYAITGDPIGEIVNKKMVGLDFSHVKNPEISKDLKRLMNPDPEKRYKFYQKFVKGVPSTPISKSPGGSPRKTPSPFPQQKTPSPKVQSAKKNDLSKMKVVDLKKLAKSRGFSGYSKLKKAELVKLLNGKMSPVKAKSVKEKKTGVSKMKVVDLKKLAKSRGLKGYSKLKKADLVKLLGQ